MESRGRAIYSASGKAERLLGISIDISVQKRVELSLRRLSPEARQRQTALASTMTWDANLEKVIAVVEKHLRGGIDVKGRPT